MKLRSITFGVLLAVLLCVPGVPAPVAPDTALLVKHLSRFRPYKVYELQTAEYTAIRDELISWVDSRLRTGISEDEMNDELKSGGLSSEGPQDIDDEFNRSYAGYLGGVGVRSLPYSPDLLSVELGIYTGGYCNFDTTVLLYQRNPLRRVARINAQDKYSHGFHLRNLVVGKAGANGTRLIGSAWVASNCTSTWNGTILDIDALRGGSLKRILNRSAGAHATADELGQDDFSIQINGNSVAFEYEGMILDARVLTRTASMHYRVGNFQAMRIAPIARSFAGFIDEWLDLGDAEAARWSTPEAARVHHATAAKFKHGGFEFTDARVCPDASHEIAVKAENPQRVIVFHVSGTTIANLRMETVSDRLSPKCQKLDLSENLLPIFGQPICY